ncbi:Glutathione S-transferase [Sandaracinus amylolyticus]|uniref:Glutathione S-transferase n=2 Tax=Sandaracinus amylolyticus TaxID=927083 RepID=A0A0F6SEM2_9BACT|nr:Glutathione S-transferase [Sandaracinus amylolyticus]
MIKLYYAPGACSLSPHVALREAGLPFELVRVDFMRGKRLETGGEFVDVSPKGYVPAVVLDDGQLLTEGVAIVQYIADQKPELGLAPPPGTLERVRLQEWLVFIATELHKGLSPLFMPQASDELKQAVKAKVRSRLELVARSLGSKPYLMGDRFTIADGYLLYALRAFQRFDSGALPGELPAYLERVSSRPAVKAALEAEGLA